MFQNLQVKKRHRQKVIAKPVQSAVHQVGQADRRHIVQIAVADLLQQPIARADRPVLNLGVDQKENRSE